MEPTPVLIDSPAAATTGPSPPPLRAKRATWLISAYILMQLGVGLVGGFAVGVYGAVLQLSPGELSTLLSGDAIILIGLISILAGGVVTFALVRRSFPGLLREGALAPIGWITTTPAAAFMATIVGAFLALTFLRFVYTTLPPAPTQEFGSIATAAAVSVGWVKFVWGALLLLAAPIEEFLFRGAMFAGFRQSFGLVWAGIIVTSVFVVCHLPETHMYGPAIISIALLGVSTLVARQLSGSLIAPICMHLAYNLVIFMESFR